MNKFSYNCLIKISCENGKSPIIWLATDDYYEHSIRICGNLCTYHDDCDTLPLILDDLVENTDAQIESIDDDLIDVIKNTINDYDYKLDDIASVLNMVNDHMEAWG